jgi:predicted MPP superfamily phosphohydrolase
VKRLLSPFVLVLTAILAVGYVYVAWRLASTPAARWALALPFAMVWIVPVVYWVYDRETVTRGDELLHAVSYVCMGWLNFLILIALARDALQGIASAFAAEPTRRLLESVGAPLVFGASLVALALGALAALRGPRVRHVDIPVEALHPSLDGVRIALISDLHVGPTVRERYVRGVVEKTNALAPDLVALTGDIVDGPVPRLAGRVAPLAELAPREGAFLVLGNHDCYAGPGPWVAHFRALRLTVLLNEHATIVRGDARIVVGGVVDPAFRLYDPQTVPRPDLAAAPGAGDAFRILLAHNPRLAPLARDAGFDLQLSGHTHAGQFFPWTLAVRLVHAPHVAGLSRLGRMWVYVSAGTGTWGPPVRIGTVPELTLLRLVRVDAPAVSTA